MAITSPEPPSSGDQSKRFAAIIGLVIVAAVLAFGGLAAGLFVAAGCEPEEPERNEAPTAGRPSPTRAGPAPKPLPLDEYLVLTFRIDQEMSRALAGLLEALPDDPSDAVPPDLARFYRDLEALVGEQSQALSGITPPSEAATYHEQVLDSLRRLEESSRDAAQAFGERDAQRIQVALGEFLTATGESGALVEEAEGLAISALEARPDEPLNAYLIAVGRVRIVFSPALTASVGELQENPENAEAIYERLIADIEAFHSAWRDVSPPSQAAAYHQDQLDILADTLDFEERFLAALRAQDQDALLEALGTGQEINARSTRLRVSLDELLIGALSADP